MSKSNEFPPGKKKVRRHPNEEMAMADIQDVFSGRRSTSISDGHSEPKGGSSPTPPESLPNVEAKTKEEVPVSEPVSPMPTEEHEWIPNIERLVHEFEERWKDKTLSDPREKKAFQQETKHLSNLVGYAREDLWKEREASQKKNVPAELRETLRATGAQIRSFDDRIVTIYRTKMPPDSSSPKAPVVEKVPERLSVEPDHVTNIKPKFQPQFGSRIEIAKEDRESVRAMSPNVFPTDDEDDLSDATKLEKKLHLENAVYGLQAYENPRVADFEDASSMNSVGDRHEANRWISSAEKNEVRGIVDEKIVEPDPLPSVAEIIRDRKARTVLGRAEVQDIPIPARTSVEQRTHGLGGEAIAAAEIEARGQARLERVADKLANEAGLERERNQMLAAERDYLDTEKMFYTKNSALGRLGKRVFGGSDQETVQSAQFRYNQSAAGFEAALHKRLSTHLLEKTKEMTAEEAEAYSEKFSKRYRRMVVSRDVIDHGEKRLVYAREQALNEKGRNALEDGLGWVGRKNKELEEKYGKQKMRAVRVLISASLGTVAAAVTGPASLAFVTGTMTARVVRGLAGVFGGAAFGAGAGSLYEKVGGASAARNLTKSREAAAVDAKSMAARRKAYRGGSKKAIERKRKIIETLSAAFAGAGISIDTAGLLADHPIVQSAVEKVVAVPEEAVPAPHEVAAAVSSVDQVTPAPDTDTTVLYNAASAEAGRGDGAIKLFAHFQENLKHSYDGTGAVPEDVQKMLAISPQEFAEKFGFYRPGETLDSANFPPGSTLRFTENGDLIFEPKGGTPVTLEHAAPDMAEDRFKGPFLHTGFKVSPPHPIAEQAPVEVPAKTEVVPETPHTEVPAAPVEAVTIQEQSASITLQDHPAVASIGPEEVQSPHVPEQPLENPSVEDTAPSPEEHPVSDTDFSQHGVESLSPDHMTHFHVNTNGATIDPAHADVYLDSTGENNVIYGGSMEDRSKLALELVTKDHSAVAYFDSTTKNVFGFPIHHITKAYWDPDTNSAQMPNERMDSSLRKLKLPNEEDLYPIPNKKS